jgi:tetraacyldisaccharide 4'-kinase
MERFFLDICAGRRRGLTAGLLRGLLTVAQIPFAAAVAARNWAFDRGLLKSRPLPRPAVSVGNITTGGTGKTPIVSWLAANLHHCGRHPAILLRGYKASNEKASDEQIVLATANPQCQVVANPNRAAGASHALAQDKMIDLFILDDAMQHRRVQRNVNIVLVHATEPWGGGHLLPRGLLREPLTGLRRASALVLTHSAEATPAQLTQIEATIRRHNADAPIFHADHQLAALVPFNASSRLPLTALRGKKYFAACGIASPESFLSLLAQHGGILAGQRFFSDHHPFDQRDAAAIQLEAQDKGAEMIIVTQKDWAKLRNFAPANSFLFADLQIRFAANHGQQLLDLVLARTTP